MDRSLSQPTGQPEKGRIGTLLPAKYGARWLEPSQTNLNKTTDPIPSELSHSVPLERKGDENVHRRIASVYSKRTWPPKPVYKSYRSMEDGPVTKDRSRHSADAGTTFLGGQQNGENKTNLRSKSKPIGQFYDHFQEPSSFHSTVASKTRTSNNLKPTQFHESQSADSLASSAFGYNSNFDRPKPYVKPKPFNKSIKAEMNLSSLRPQSENSFFDMVKDYKNELKNVDQRSPASKTIAKVLGPGLDGSTTTGLLPKNHFQNNTSPEASKPMRIASEDAESQCAALKCWSLERDRPRQSFAHYDWQSTTYSFADVLIAIETLKRKNEMTGASKAAAMTARMHSAENSPASSFENLQDLRISNSSEDVRTNDVLGWCPFFCNEIGGEIEEDTLSPDSSQLSTCSQTPAVSVQLLLPENSTHSITNSPTTAQMLLVNHKGVSVMEKVGIDDDKQLNAVGFIQEYVDGGALYYRKHFFQQDHQNFFGIDEKYGSVAISIKREKLKEANANIKENAWHFRIIVRASELCTLRGSVLEDVILSQHYAATRGLRTRDVLEYVCPEINFDCLKSAPSTEAVQKQLMKVDEQNVTNSYKIGIMYCKKGQTTEEEMYNNEHGSPALEEFLDLLGNKIQLKGFDKFRGGLDVKTNSTGKESYFTTFQGIQIMFHVSTLLPYTANNVQQLLRKRHIGNDIVTIVFQEPDSPPFSPQNIRSHFQHLFVVIRVHQPCSSRTCYRIAVTRSQDIPAFGPLIPKDALFPKSETFREFLLTKLLNGERAARSAGKFKAMSMNTRQEYLRDLALNHCSPNGLDASQKFTKFSLSAAASRRVRDRDKSKNKPSPEEFSLGALVWHVTLQGCGPKGIPCMLAISDYMFLLIRKSTNRVIFSIPCQAIIGWAEFSSDILHLYYGRGERISIRASSCASCDWKREVKLRLQSFSFGCETKSKTLRRNARGQLGFHINYEGIVMDVEANGYANHVGLLQGSRLVEICKVLVVTMTHEEMLDLLRTSDVVAVIMIPPLEDGTPRRCSKSLYHISPVLKMIEIIPDSASASSGDDAVVHSRSKSDPASKTARHNKSLEDITQALAYSLTQKHAVQSARGWKEVSSASDSAASTPTTKMNSQFSKRPVKQSASVDPNLIQHHYRPQTYARARPNHFTTIPLKKNKDKHYMDSGGMKHSTSTESGLNLTSYDYENNNNQLSETFTSYAKPRNFKGHVYSSSATNTPATTPTTKVNPLPTRRTEKGDKAFRQRFPRPQPYHPSQQNPTITVSGSSNSNQSSNVPLKQSRDWLFPGSNGMKHSTSTESGLDLNTNFQAHSNKHFSPARRKKVGESLAMKGAGDAKTELITFVEQKHKKQPSTRFKNTGSPSLDRKKPSNHHSRRLKRTMSDESICGIIQSPRWRNADERDKLHVTVDPLMPLPNLADNWDQIVHAANTAEEFSPASASPYDADLMPSGSSDCSDNDVTLLGTEEDVRSAASMSPILPQDTASSEENYEPMSHISTQSDADLRLRKIEDALKSLQTQLAKEQRSKKKILREVERLRKDNRRLQKQATSQQSGPPNT